MIFGLFGRRSANRKIVAALHSTLVEAAREPVFYLNGVPDTVEGRFDLVTLHAHLVVRRLKAMPAPADELAQDLTDAVFSNFEAALRELGVGDVTVPKKMKVMASAFLGRAKAYEQALTSADPAELSTVIARNVLGVMDHVPRAAEQIAQYVRAAVLALDGVEFDAFTSGRLPFPDPEPFFGQEICP